MIYPKINKMIEHFVFSSEDGKWLKELSLFLGLRYNISYINFQRKERGKIVFAIITNKHRFHHSQIDIIRYETGEVLVGVDESTPFILENTSESIEQLIKTINDNL
jgi:hypothetical protein